MKIQLAIGLNHVSMDKLYIFTDLYNKPNTDIYVSLKIGNPPDPDFCVNGGTCLSLDTLSPRICQCATGFIGERCHFQQPTIEVCEKTITLNIMGLYWDIKINCAEEDWFEEQPQKQYFVRKI